MNLYINKIQSFKFINKLQVVVFMLLGLPALAISAGQPLESAPPAYMHVDAQSNVKKLVPIDISKVHTEILFNEYGEQEGDLKADVVATVQFVSGESGHPMFFFRGKNIKEARLNGELVELFEISLPDQRDSVSYVNKPIQGDSKESELKIRYQYDYNEDQRNSRQLTLINYTDGTFGELLYPSNFRFDLIHFTETIRFALPKGESYKVYANGSVKKSGRNTYLVDHLGAINSSALFVDIAKISELTEEVISVSHPLSGRKVNVTIYGTGELGKSNFAKYKTEALAAFARVDKQLGSYPFSSVIFGIRKSGGASFPGIDVGAIVLEEWYLPSGASKKKRWFDHELAHHYGVQFQNGHDGWLFEGLAEWARGDEYTDDRDKAADADFVAYRAFQIADNATPVRRFRKTLVVRPPTYYQEFPRQTSWDAGRKLYPTLAYLLKDYKNPNGPAVNGFANLLKEVREEYQTTPLSGLQFLRILEEKSGVDLSVFIEHYFVLDSSVIDL